MGGEDEWPDDVPRPFTYEEDQEGNYILNFKDKTVGVAISATLGHGVTCHTADLTVSLSFVPLTPTGTKELLEVDKDELQALDEKLGALRAEKASLH